jgi:putative spermidine/putrescine transport system permease protein
MARQHSNQHFEVLHGYVDLTTVRVLRIIALIIGSAIAVPALYMVIWAVWGTEVVGRLSFSKGGVSTIEQLLHDEGWQESIVYSTILAVVTTATGTLLNLIFSYCKRFTNDRIRNATSFGMIVLLLNPLVAYGMALRSVGAILSLPWWIILYCGHLAVILPLQYLVFEAATGSVETDTLWAARTCGATHFDTFWHIFAPSLRTATFAALVLGFFASFDEVVIALFVLDASIYTVPLRLWKNLSHVVRPEAAVISTLLLCTIGLIAGIRYATAGHSGFFAIGLRERWEREKHRFFGAGLAIALSFHPIFEHFGRLGHGLIELLSGPLTYYLMGTISAWGPISDVLHLANPERRELRNVPRDFAFRSIKEDVKRAEELRTAHWIEVDRDHLRVLTDACFAQCEGFYIGTDRNVPSEFIKLYPDYLRTQLERRIATRDVRMLFCTEDDLKNDVTMHSLEVVPYIRAHAAANVLLLVIPLSIAMPLAVKAGLPSAEFGLFAGEYVLFFRAPENKDAVASVMLKPIDTELRSHLSNFLLSCIPHLKRVSEDDWNVRFFVEEPSELRLALDSKAWAQNA